MSKASFGLAVAVLAGALFAARAAPAAPLPVETIVIETAHGPRIFRMEIAADERSQDRGLMFRKHMAPDRGMLFDFHRKVMTAFWMKNTIIPLDILFVRADGTISTIAARAVPYSTKEIVSAEPIRAVIEINGGRSQALGIVPGGIVHASAFGNTGTRGHSG